MNTNYAKLAAAALLAALVAVTGGCCFGKPGSSSYHASWWFSGGLALTDVEWTSRRPATSPESVLMFLPDDDRSPGDLLEVFDAVAARVELPRTVHLSSEDRRRRPNSCSASWVEYDLRGLPAGDYLLVHRRSSQMPGFSIVPDDAWTEFEGEEALVVDFRVEPPATDGGATTDAGP